MSRRERLVLAVHHANPPSDDEWSRWIELCLEHPSQLRALVETHGGGPNAKQRKELADRLEGLDLRSAILTDSVVVRGLVTALAWLGVSLRAFAPEQIQQAADYLGVSSEELAWARSELVKLRQTCGVSDDRRAS